MTVRITGKCMINYLNRSLHSNFKPNGNYQVNKKNLDFLVFKRMKSGVCWKCGVERKDVAQIFCEKCNVIQSPHEKANYFKVFDISETFNIDQQLLRNKFRTLQSLLHPDKFSNKTDEEKAISEEYSSLLNKAYSSLQVPLKRAEHLLNLKGEEIGEGQSIDDPSFLMEVMTLNEEVESANNLEKLKELNLKNRKELEIISKDLDACFESSNIQKAKENVVKLKYYTSISRRINGILRELGDTD